MKKLFIILTIFLLFSGCITIYKCDCQKPEKIYKYIPAEKNYFTPMDPEYYFQTNPYINTNPTLPIDTLIIK